MPTRVQRYEFEVIPAGWDRDSGDELAGLRFEPFILSVPTLGTHDQAARRAWWQVFHLLGARGIDHDEYEVFEFEGIGRPVGREGFGIERFEPAIPGVDE